jgi:hypothetical protein
VTAEELRVAVRAWTTPIAVDNAKKASAATEGGRGNGGTRRSASGTRALGASRWQLIFDTETHRSLGQAIRILTWQTRKDGKLRERGVAYEPGQITDAEIATVQAYARRRGLTVLTVREWVVRVLHLIAVKRRGLVIGFNLPFDLSRLALAHAATKPRYSRRMAGGWSFRIADRPWVPRVQIKRVNGRAAFIRLAAVDGTPPEKRNRSRGGQVANHSGYFCDVAVAAAALLGKKQKLRDLAKTLGTATQKRDVEHGEEITEDYLDYACDDVQVTWECHQKLAERYDSYRLSTPLHRIYSEAGIGKAHLKDMGVRPWRQVQPDAPDWLIATMMETYYGGRTECGIRGPMPGVSTDLTPEYSTSFVLQRLWRFYVADRIDWEDEDPAIVTGQLEEMGVDRLLDPAFWPELTRLVLIAPDGDLLPTRCDFAGGGTVNLAIARRCGGPAQWYTYAHALSSWLATGRTPRILRVLRFTAGPAQPGLSPIDLTGRADFPVDPYRDDRIRRSTELRTLFKDDRDIARAEGREQDAVGLDGQQQGNKTVSSSTAYGIPIEVNTDLHRRPQPVTVHRPGGGSYLSRTTRVEQPGQFFHPLIATLVAGGGQLALALVMRLVADQGGSYVFCDTDSLFIVATEDGGIVACPGGPHRLPDDREAVLALSWAQVRDIAGQFIRLNPYGAPLAGRSLLKIEDENFDPATGQQWQIWCYSIASKRYALYRHGDDGIELVGDPAKRKRSEHGLGHLYDPTDPAPNPDSDKPAWRDEWWLQILHDELGIPREQPAWFDWPAVGRLAVTSRAEERNFAVYNAGKRYAARTGPFNFAMMCFPHHPGEAGALIAPLQTDPRRWSQVRWYRRNRPGASPVQVRTGDPLLPIPGTVTVKSIRDVYNEYADHPEAKAAGPDGKPCTAGTRGLLQPRTIVATQLVRIGKETNRLADTEELVDGDDDRPVVYQPIERHCRGCDALIEGRRGWCSEACRKRASRGTDKPPGMKPKP